jgi:hypothetical protein
MASRGERWIGFISRMRRNRNQESRSRTKAARYGPSRVGSRKITQKIHDFMIFLIRFHYKQARRFVAGLRHK